MSSQDVNVDPARVAWVTYIGFGGEVVGIETVVMPELGEAGDAVWGDLLKEALRGRNPHAAGFVWRHLPPGGEAGDHRVRF